MTAHSPCTQWRRFIISDNFYVLIYCSRARDLSPFVSQVFKPTADASTALCPRDFNKNIFWTWLKRSWWYWWNCVKGLSVLFTCSSEEPLDSTHCPACRTTLVATRFRVAVICPIIQVPHCIRVFFYFVWFVFINHIFQFYYELCTYCNILDIFLS